MEITGKVYCFFEQSGTFKNEFKKLGYGEPYYKDPYFRDEKASRSTPHVLQCQLFRFQSSAFGGVEGIPYAQRMAD